MNYHARIITTHLMVSANDTRWRLLAEIFLEHIHARASELSTSLPGILLGTAWARALKQNTNEAS